jgi:hypothetical protein
MNRMAVRADHAQLLTVKALAILVVVVGIAAAVWPLYRKFFINEWRERIVGNQPVIFIPDCPVVSAQLKCGDRYTMTFRIGENNQWCARVRKNMDSEGSESCGIDIDGWDFARSWRYFSVEGVRLYYSWRGRVIITPNQVAGWLAVPENLALRERRPLSIQ